MAMPTNAALSLARSEPRTRTALLLESIALRHQIAVLERSGTRRRCFRLWIGCFGSCSRVGGPNGATAWSSSSPRRSCAGAVRAGQRFGDIVPGALAVGARGLPAKSDI